MEPKRADEFFADATRVGLTSGLKYKLLSPVRIVEIIEVLGNGRFSLLLVEVSLFS